MSLTADHMLRMAQQQTGLEDLGAYGNVHIAGFRRLAESLQADDRLSEAGRRRVQIELFYWLTRYLIFEGDLAAHPEVRAVPMAKPVFIAGFGRTGSTFLHHLLALDPRFRTPQLWELLHPFPPPRPETYHSDPRIERTRRSIAASLAVSPEVVRLHPMAAQAPDECNWIMRHGPQQLMRYRGLRYWDWLMALEGEALRQLCAHYKLQIQFLQLHCRAEHWLGKSIHHQFFLPVLFDVFPDARVIRLHREPVHCIPSLATLAVSYRRLYYGSRVDRRELGRWILDLFVENTRRMVDADRSAPEGRCIDIGYDALIEDPLAAVRRIYRHLGCELSPAVAESMTAHIARAGATYKSGWAHDPAEFGLSAGEIAERSAGYSSWLSERDLLMADRLR
jgi:hypothetical protein